VSDAELQSLFEAARWASSSYNEQPWRFLVARKADEGVYKRFLELLVPANQAWAKTAPILIIMAAKRTFTHNGSPNRYGLHDAGQALAQLALQATALGLHAHAMGGFDYERARKELGIPADYEIGAAVAIGYLSSPSDGPQNDRSRKPLEEIVFGEKFGDPLMFTEQVQNHASIA
jgi:nitroreductase